MTMLASTRRLVPAGRELISTQFLVFSDPLDCLSVQALHRTIEFIDNPQRLGASLRRGLLVGNGFVFELFD